MAAPKGKGGGGGGGGGSGKKAKLAHEKRGQEEGGDKGQFRLKKVLELVKDGGKNAAVVEIDDKGTKAVVDSIYVQKAADGTLKGREIACPALYDSVAQKNAIARYSKLAQA